MTRLIAAAVCLVLLGALAGCAGGGSPRVSYSVGVGYGSYYGPSAWSRYPGRPVYVVGGGRPDIPDIPDGPVAAPMPDFGMPDMGGMADFDF